MPDPILVGVTRTVRLRIAEGADPVAIRAIASTQVEWAKAIRFYTDLFLEHPDVYEEKKTVRARRGEEREVSWTGKDLLTWAERVTVRTEDHPTVLHDFSEVCPQMPVTLRRAAINAASGAVASHLTNHKLWEMADPATRGREPRPPDPHPNVTLYGGMYHLDVDRLRKGSCCLKVLSGGRWRWIDVPLQMPPYALDLFTRSEAEQARIAAERAGQNARMADERRERRTSEEKERLRASPGVWVAQSPTLVAKPDGFYLHVPFEKRVEVKGKAEERRLKEPTLKVGTIDLNADSAVAAAWEGERCIGVETVWHAQENAKRERTLRKVARKQKASGTPVKGERSNRALWAYVRNLDASLAWQIAARIVAWAVTLGLQVLVFEHLRPYRPERGLSWSRRTNRKRSYWLRGQVLRHVRDLALREGILVVERNPAWTSQACPACHRLAERLSPSGVGYPSRLHCGHCAWSGDANVAAALNLKLKWDRTFRYPTAAERKAAEPRRAGNGGAAVNPEQVPAAG
ncbi:MAG: transposase [Thermaerobacter sp.]|nr:transposase [Thermaerobacter sp.]